MQVAESDVLSAIKFSQSGEYLALGDNGGRVILFKRSSSASNSSKHSSSRYFDYKYLTEIQSHEPEFDCLKSLELDEKINAVEFLRDKNAYNSSLNASKPSVSFLSTNDRVIKLWKVDYRVQKETSRAHFLGDNLFLPKSNVIGEGYFAKEKYQYRGCHNYNVNSISLAQDGEIFLSADDLRINMWNIENNTLAFNIVDLKPGQIEELSEVITHVEFHPVRSDMFVYSSSKGYINCCDLRINSNSESFSTRFQIEEEPSRKHFFTDIINSVSRAKFSPVDPNFLFSRDYIAVHIWDIRNTKTPYKTFNVTDYLEKKLCEVYENETIFDKFDLQISPDST